ncbi:hypothetical protein [Actinomyces sp.]|uniref:hypothetical protein n=1 Tax=Actinomyces sp. TaxID=29317 RepID=UPI0026DBD7C7|nr:hypothetical protein [Actinomyces sp.]MDO4655443.1 hypothetical protein [Actinomyces sp.]
MSAATALVRSLKAEVRKTVGLPGVWLGAALAIFLPLLIEYYTDHDLAARLAAGDPDAPARLGDVGVIGLYVGTTGIVVLAVSVVVSEYASDPRTSGASSAPRQVATTMLVLPRRGASMAAKLLVVLGAATVLLATAWAVTYSLCRHLLGVNVPFESVPGWMLTGILTWWVFSAMASMALAMVTRSALVSMTVLVAVAGGAAVATMMSVLQNVVDGQGFGFEEVAPVWALAVQIGFVAAGVAAAGAEHSTAQGMTSLLVTPVRGRLAMARLMVLAGIGLVAASVLVGASLAACPAMSTAALWAGERTLVWLTAVLLLSAGLGAALRSVIGASTAAVVLVILAPQLAVFLGDAARWLPGQAAQIWLAADASRADVASAGLIILAWTTAAQMAGIVRLVRADG